MRLPAALLAIAALTAPASAQSPNFDRPNTSQQTFMQDRFACIQASQVQRSRGFVGTWNFGNGPHISGGSRGGTFVSRGMYISCMGAKGYKNTPNGRFAPPDGGTVWMVQ